MRTRENGFVGWSPEQWDAFRALPRTTPLHMLNMIRLRERAEYPADHPNHGKGLTGWEAYREYGRAAAPVFARVGARQIWTVKPELMLIGPTEEQWDLIFVAAYPNAHAFIEMMRDPVYQRAVPHRTAAVRDSRLIRCLPATAGEVFSLSGAS